MSTHLISLSKVVISGHNINDLERAMLDILSYMDRRKGEFFKESRFSCFMTAETAPGIKFTGLYLHRVVKKNSSLYIYYIEVQKKFSNPLNKILDLCIWFCLKILYQEFQNLERTVRNNIQRVIKDTTL